MNKEKNETLAILVDGFEKAMDMIATDDEVQEAAEVIANVYKAEKGSVMYAIICGYVAGFDYMLEIDTVLRKHKPKGEK